MGTDARGIERPRAGAIGAALLLLAGVALCAVTIVGRILTANVATLDPDEFAFALVARDVLEGKLPYAGVFDDKPVGLYYVFALAEWLGNRSLASVHAVGLVCASIAGWLVYLSGRGLRVARAPCVALAGVFGLEVVALSGWASMSELVVAPLICAANLVILRRPTRWTTYAGLGLLFGLAGQISYLALPGLALATLGLLAPSSIEQSLRRAGAVAAGFVAATVLVWVPQILTGDWPPYIQDQFHFYRRYRLTAQPFSQFLVGFLLPALDIFIPLVVAAVAALRMQGGGPRMAAPPAFWPMALQLTGMLLAACASNRYYSHYLVLTLPALAGLTALLFAAAPPNRARLATVILLTWGAGAAFISLDQIPALLGPPRIEQKASQLVDSLVGPGRRLFVFNETPAIYFLSRSQAVQRYVVPNDYLPSCDGVADMDAATTVIAEALRAHPDLILAGSLCHTDLDSGALFWRAGYRLVGEAQDGDRKIAAYAPRGARLSPLGLRRAAN